jgi:hypothetical protein
VASSTLMENISYDKYKKKSVQDAIFAIVLFFLVFWGGVRLSLLGTSANIWPVVPAPDDRWWRVWSSRWNEDWQGKPKYSEKTCPSATLSTTNPTYPDLGSNPCRRGGKPATNRLSYGAAPVVIPLLPQYPAVVTKRVTTLSLSLSEIEQDWKGCTP